MLDLYVYYKVREENAARLQPLVRAMQATLSAQCGQANQLKRRPDAPDGIQTWMEVYPAADDTFPAALAAAVRTAGFDGLIEGPRRAEVFTDLTPCA
jgi:hypothetical protein